MQATTHACVRDNMRDKKQKNARERNNAELQNLPPELLELMTQDEEPKMNYTGGFIAILVILLILGLIALATYITMPYPDKVIVKDPLTFQRLRKARSLLQKFQYQHFTESKFIVYRNGSNRNSKRTKFYRTWFSDTHFGKTNVLFELNMKDINKKDISVSPDLKFALIKDELVQMSKSPAVSKYKLFSIYDLSKGSAVLKIGDDQSHELLVAAWGIKSQELIVVDKKGNIHWSETPMQQFSFNCLSCDLDQSRMYGVLIGVYQKIIKSGRGFWWNKSGSRLAFVSLKKENDKVLFVRTAFDELYPDTKPEILDPAYKVKQLYHIQVFTVSAPLKKSKKLKLPNYLNEGSFYLVHIDWLTESELLLVTMSRNQQKIVMTVCDVVSDGCFKIFSQESSKGFVTWEDFQSIKFSESHRQLILLTRPSFASSKAILIINIETPATNKYRWLEMNYFKQNIQLISLANYYPITNDIFSLVSLIGPNTKSTKQRNELQYFRTNLVTGQSSCLTCSHRQFDWCSENEADWFNNAVFIHACHSRKNFTQSSAPAYSLHSTNHLLTNLENPTERLVLESNNGIRQFLHNISMPFTFSVNVPLKSQRYPHEKYFVTTKVHRPFDLNPAHVIKYPVVVSISDLPLQPQSPYHKLQVSFIDFIVSYLRYVVVEITPSSYQGVGSQNKSPDNLMIQTDTYDVTQALMYLLANESYLDPNSITAITEKYGAYLILKQLENTKYFPHIRCAVMIDPILDFRKYEFFFTEKYFGNFSSNRINYETTILKVTPDIQNKDILFISNIVKEPVLFEGLARYLKDLVKLGVIYNILPIYDSSNYSWNTNDYIIKYMTRYLVNCINNTKIKNTW